MSKETEKILKSMMTGKIRRRRKIKISPECWSAAFRQAMKSENSDVANVLSEPPRMRSMGS